MWKKGSFNLFVFYFQNILGNLVSYLRNPARDMQILFLSRSLNLIFRSLDIIILRERIIKSRDRQNILRERLIKSRERHNIWGNDLLSRGNDLISRRNDIISRGNDLLSRGNDLSSCGNDIISWGNDLLSRGNDMISWWNDLLSRWKDLLSRGNDITSRENDLLSWGIYLFHYDKHDAVLTVIKWWKFGSRSAILRQYDLLTN